MGEGTYHQPHFPLCCVSVSLNYPAIARRWGYRPRKEGRMKKWYDMKQSQWTSRRENVSGRILMAKCDYNLVNPQSSFIPSKVPAPAVQFHLLISF